MRFTAILALIKYNEWRAQALRPYGFGDEKLYLVTLKIWRLRHCAKPLLANYILSKDKLFRICQTQTTGLNPSQSR